MSFDLNVTGRNINFDPEKWKREIGRYLEGFAFDSSIEWDNHSGFLPTSWIDPDDSENRIESGFDFSYEKMKPNILKSIFNSGSTSQNINFMFSFSSDDDEFKVGWISAGVLTQMYNASLNDPQEGEDYEGLHALEHALKNIEPSNQHQSDSEYIFDSKEFKAFKKKNANEIHKIAKEILTPYGIMREGKSKSWLDDHGWHTIFIEFLPFKSGWGTIVRVAANFHWHQKDYMSYDVFTKTNAKEFDTPEECSAYNKELIQEALNRVLDLRETMSDLNSIRNSAINSTETYEPHKSYHLGILSGLLGDIPGMRDYFNVVLAKREREEPDWLISLKDQAQELLDNSDNQKVFRMCLKERINTTRSLKKLPEIEFEIPS